jgi:hypothetical protein
MIVYPEQELITFSDHGLVSKYTLVTCDELSADLTGKGPVR